MDDKSTTLLYLHVWFIQWKCLSTAMDEWGEQTKGKEMAVSWKIDSANEFGELPKNPWPSEGYCYPQLLATLPGLNPHEYLAFILLH